jgi:hypothetical protein
MLFITLIHLSFSEWNPLLMQLLEELHTVFHVVSCLLVELENSSRDFSLLRSLIAQLRGRTLIIHMHKFIISLISTCKYT